jgi:hypothetical protein
MDMILAHMKDKTPEDNNKFLGHLEKAGLLNKETDNPAKDKQFAKTPGKQHLFEFVKTDDRGRTILHYAAEAGQVEAVRKILEAAQAGFKKHGAS